MGMASATAFPAALRRCRHGMGAGSGAGGIPGPPPLPEGELLARLEGHIVAKPADIDELLCAAVLSVFRSCKHNE